MTDTGVTEIKRRTPSIIKDDKGRERIENGKWNSRAMAGHVSSHPEKFHTGASLCRVANERASETNVERRRRCLTIIADIMLELGFPAVLEWSGRKIVAISRYNPQNEYHQNLMATEIGRRRLVADGKAERLESLIAAIPARSDEEILHSIGYRDER